MATPKPGARVRGSRTGKPIMALLDLLGRRWALRILWELREGGGTFRELRERCGRLSPTVLNERLRELREARIVELAPSQGEGTGRDGARREAEGGFRLTDHGESLLRALAPLAAWSAAWAKRV
jgi:DNA-binding HxlR family transcriptional regulator